jgi:hypothetical protein
MVGTACGAAFADAAMVRAGKAEDQLEEQMNASIRMEPEESSPARTPGGLSFFCHALLLYPNQIESDRAPGFIISREFSLTTVSADKLLLFRRSIRGGGRAGSGRRECGDQAAASAAGRHG